MEEYKSFGEYLKSLRIQKGLTAEEVGEKIEIKIDKIKAFERNIEIPELDEMYKLSEFYNVPCEHLLRLKDELFKPNTKLIWAIAKFFGVSIKTAIVIMYIGLGLALIASWLFFWKSARDVSQNLKESRR